MVNITFEPDTDLYFTQKENDKNPSSIANMWFVKDWIYKKIYVVIKNLKRKTKENSFVLK